MAFRGLSPSLCRPIYPEHRRCHPVGHVAVAESHKGTFDLLLTDVIMPKMNGRELAAILIKTHPALKVLYVSDFADGSVRDGVHGPLEGGLEFLQKPYTRSAVIGKIREILDLP
jgi:two-component system, cell cycle sensor histidine kinase and response regulator CckA